MNKKEAYQAMLDGYKVRNEYYGQEEFLFINNEGKIEAEDGCVFGTQFDEAWVKYQDPENKYEWEIVIDPYLSKFYEEGVKSLKLENLYDPSIFYPECTKRQLNEVVIPVKSSNPIGRNDLCPCGSGKKYKYCCYHDKR